VVGAQHRAGRRVGPLGEDHRGRRGPLQIGRVFVVGEEGEVSRTGLGDARDARDLGVAVSFEAAFEPYGYVTEFQARSI
jgi:hypothetical protein